MIPYDYISIGFFLSKYGANDVVNCLFLQLVVYFQFKLGATVFKAWTNIVCDVQPALPFPRSFYT